MESLTAESDNNVSNDNEIAVSNTTTINTSSQAKKKKSDGLIHVTELNRRIQEMIGQYILLEEFYMVESVRKVPDSLYSYYFLIFFFVVNSNG